MKFIEFLSNQKLPEIIVSTGMTDQKYVKDIINKFRNLKKLYLMHAVSCYPCSFTDINLNIVKNYAKINKNIIPGYSSHDPGYFGSMLAVAAGAIMVEKHVKTGVTNWMHYDDTAIDVKFEFPNFVEMLNKAYIAMGSSKKEVYTFEHHKYDF